jgi:hypothetical protein
MPLKILCRLLLLCALAPGAARSGSAASVGVSEVTGKDAPALLQRPTASFRVYAFHEAAAVPIPFQVDERDRRDHWADDQGPEPVRDESPGVFDANDVVVFMNRDLGEKGDPAKLPRGAATWLEVRVGSQDEPLGYAYLGAFDSPPAIPSDQPVYVRCDPTKDEVFADRYTVRFGAPLPTYLALVRQQGESPENVLNGVRANGEVRIFAGLFHFARNEKDLEYSIQGYRTGPVRTIRSARYWIGLPLGFKARGRVELLFYRDFVEARAQVNIRIPPRLVAADGHLTAFFDFHDFAGAHVLGPDGLLAEPIGGQMTETNRQFAGRPVRWSALLLPSGQSVLLAVRLGGSLQRLDQQLYLAESIDPARGRPSFGFTLAGINRLDSGEQELSVNAMVLDSTAQSQITAAAAKLLSPPEVAVTPVGKSGPRPLRRTSCSRPLPTPRSIEDRFVGLLVSQELLFLARVHPGASQDRLGQDRAFHRDLR